MQIATALSQAFAHQGLQFFKVNKSVTHVAVGDVVVAKGTVRTDVKLGAGYADDMLVDEAKLSKS